tara:strand:- start:631 stop:1158 length:528 start_codon:yes stop_codon:yes gene_type:complete
MNKKILFILLFSLVFITACTPETQTKKECFTLKEYEIRGTSLTPILNPGETVAAQLNYYNCNNIEKNDIALLKISGREDPVIKIIKGIPEDKLELKETNSGFNILVNDKLLTTSNNTPYVFQERKAKLISLYIKDYNSKIPKDAYLVLGNKPSGTYDSTAFGLIGKANVIGKIQF